MKFKLSPLAAMMSSTLLVSSFSHAATDTGGANGADGGSAVQSASVNLIGGFANGGPGTTDADAAGKPASNITGKSVTFNGPASSGSLVIGSGGMSGETYSYSVFNPIYGAGAGAGGTGGASAIGGISTAGAAGNSLNSPPPPPLRAA
ncbi:hypothetical protein D555_1100 [Bordetella holmesii 35009]|nr:hypothetical protein D555_1100 [Bordetella holmesii 35009]